MHACTHREWGVHSHRIIVWNRGLKDMSVVIRCKWWLARQALSPFYPLSHFFRLVPFLSALIPPFPCLWPFLKHLRICFEHPHNPHSCKFYADPQLEDTHVSYKKLIFLHHMHCIVSFHASYKVLADPLCSYAWLVPSVSPELMTWGLLALLPSQLYIAP